MDAFEKIQEYFSSYSPLSDEAKEAIIKEAEYKEYPPKTVLLSEGQVEKQLYFLNKGLVRGCFNMVDRAITLWICYEPGPFGNPESFFNETPSDIYIETVEPSQILTISYQRWHELLDQFPEIERASRMISQSNVQRLYQRIMILHYGTPEEKYKYLLENEPQIIQRTPLKFIATYLNITPETLSRIRAKI
ncbi:Crp/Fnr family transcriptional regulator [Solitalea sp. MAHUQ-68]|uniref:Crp/Fnr family transcriptional regulator n=1 Tax=Solitalea agri TaxID=2953739 RepID=A0A9X2EZV7_9SPHI|nr:Crp/Fnr family transcriptional regulator [Solitalea agri]MCO4291499.1 Crp/Fnr family transcriptional regulator [Solitalea agri]